MRVLGFYLWACALMAFAVFCFGPAASVEDDLVQWGAPDNGGRHVGPFLVNFDGRSRCARWTLERLDVAALKQKAVRDTERFVSDPDIAQEFRPTPSDYAKTGYDIGHCVPAADCMLSEEDLGTTFTLSNACPQQPDLNRGEWKRLENHIRELASESRRTVWVVTCPLWLPEKRGDSDFLVTTIGSSKVWVPTHCGKAILIHDQLNIFTCRAWILPNRKNVDNYEKYRVSTDEFEAASGLDLWSKLPDEEEDKLEAVK